jgi:hypothetical protein
MVSLHNRDTHHSPVVTEQDIMNIPFSLRRINKYDLHYTLRYQVENNEELTTASAGKFYCYLEQSFFRI